MLKDCLYASGDSKKAWLLRICAFLAGCCLVASQGPVLAFNTFAIAFKTTFTLTQTQVEVAMSVTCIGSTLGFHVSWLHSLVGPRLTAVLGQVLLILGFGLLYGSTYLISVHHDNPWLLYLYCFIIGLGAVTSMMIALSVNQTNFSRKTTGKVIGMMEMCYNFGSVGIAVVYNFMYVQGHYINPEEQDLRGFFLNQTITWTLVGALGFTFLGHVPPSSEVEVITVDFSDMKSGENIVQEEGHENGLLLQGICMSNSAADAFHVSTVVPDTKISPCDVLMDASKKLYPAENFALGPEIRDLDTRREASLEVKDPLLLLKAASVGGLKAFQYPEFLLLWCIFIIFGGIETMFFSNITTILYSVHVPHLNNVLTIVPPLLTAITCPMMSALSDFTLKSVPRITFLFIGAFIQTLCFIALLAKTENPVLLIITSILISIIEGTIFTITIIMISELWGAYYFPTNLSTFLLGANLNMTVIQILLGIFYQQQIIEEGQIYCFGAECFTDMFIMCTCLQVIGLFGFVYLIKRQLHSYTNRVLENKKEEQQPLINQVVSLENGVK